MSVKYVSSILKDFKLKFIELSFIYTKIEEQHAIILTLITEDDMNNYFEKVNIFDDYSIVNRKDIN